MWFQGSTPYKLLRRVDYPFELEDDKTIKEQAVYDKLRTFISEASSNKEFVVGENMEIPLSLIMPHVNDCCSSTDELELVYTVLNIFKDFVTCCFYLFMLNF